MLGKEQTVDISYVLGCKVTVINPLGHMIVEHDGDITWDTLQEIKNMTWGLGTAAIEVYPPQADVVNSMNARHLWRLGSGDFWPDMLGKAASGCTAEQGKDMLEARYTKAWIDWAMIGRKTA